MPQRPLAGRFWPRWALQRHEVGDRDAVPARHWGHEPLGWAPFQGEKRGTNGGLAHALAKIQEVDLSFLKSGWQP